MSTNGAYTSLFGYVNPNANLATQAASAGVYPTTTKGDLLSCTGTPGTIARLGVGTNGQALIANSATGTGLNWASYDHVNLLSKGTNTHAQIDTHIASASNIHGVTGAIVGTTDS